MKILIILKKWTGGVGVVVKNIKKDLEKRGHVVKVISREEDLKRYSLIKSIFPIRKKVKELMKTGDYDIIYTQDWSIAFPLVFPLFSSRHFCCFHGNDPSKIGKLIQHFIGILFGKKLIVVGPSLKKRFPKSNLIYNGVDLKMFKPLNKKRNCLGWINKGTEIINEEEVIRLAKKTKLNPLIAKNFSIPFDKMNEEFYNRCEVFISLPPKSAGFNLCWVESMAAGVPKIVGNNEGIGKKLGINKFKDKKELFENVKNLKRKNYRKEIEKSDFTWIKSVDKLLEIWRR